MPSGRKPFFPELLPEWFTLMNEKGLLSSKDVAALFDFKSANIASKAARDGDFPKPDQRLGDSRFLCNGQNRKRCFWLKATILAEIERRKKICAQ